MCIFMEKITVLLREFKSVISSSCSITYVDFKIKVNVGLHVQLCPKWWCKSSKLWHQDLCFKAKTKTLMLGFEVSLRLEVWRSTFPIADHHRPDTSLYTASWQEYRQTVFDKLPQLNSTHSRTWPIHYSLYLFYFMCCCISCVLSTS